MKGLLKDNFYTAYANEKAWFVIMFLVGIIVAVVVPDGGVFIRNYMLICIVGFSYVTLDSLGKDSTCKWEKYKLIAPVTRADIVESGYVGQLIWLGVGMIFVSVPTALVIVLHGYPFDLGTDLVLIYVIGISISLFMGAIFFPIFYLFGTERKEVSLLISILSSIAVVVGIVALLNYLFGPGMTSVQIILSGVIVLACAGVVFGASCLLTIGIFRRKEY